jgi:hypothetical protein
VTPSRVGLCSTIATPFLSLALAIEVSGLKHPSSSGYLVDIDAFDVVP